ncbi:glycosyltransferase family 2 protein [Psychrobacter celer]|uniref:glycosyltransferase family 2 protein n=1 Tax=Psychrobacter celer TaxID=306572 RepID=UPI003FCF5F86
MINSLTQLKAYNRHVKNRDFVYALALLPDKEWAATSKRRWMCARLGIYTPLLEAGWNGCSTRSGVAYAQALSAYGYVDECQAVLQKLSSKLNISRYLPELIREFSKYNAHLSIGLIEQASADKQIFYYHALKYAYLSQNINDHQNINAHHKTDYIHSFLDHNSFKNPDLLLLKSNLVKDSEEKLKLLNQYQTYFKLPKYELVSPQAPLNSLNLTLTSPIHHNSLSTLESNAHKVSILTTVYNAQQFIASTLTSLLNQSWSNLEVVLIDDASTDNSLAIAEKMAEKDKRLKILKQPANQGTYIAKTKGLEYAKGEFIICHDSDDWAHPLKIEQQVMPLLLDSCLQGTTSDWIKVDENGKYYTRVVYPYTRKNPSSLMFRRRAIEKLTIGANYQSLWQPVRTGADSELYERFKLIFGQNASYHVKKPLTLGAHHSSSLMNADKTGTKNLSARISRLTYWEQWRREHIDMVRRWLL